VLPPRLHGPEGTNAAWIIATHRMKFLVHCFESYYIDEAFDRDRANIVAEAERMLRFCEAQQAGAPEDLDGEEELVSFMKRYNQSLDWLFHGKENALICRLASHRPMPQKEVTHG
jgi:hypothetical protein